MHFQFCDLTKKSVLFNGWRLCQLIQLSPRKTRSRKQKKTCKGNTCSYEIIQKYSAELIQLTQ